MARIVVLGAGIGGIPMALEAKEILGKEHQVTVINDKDWFEFTPSNPWVAVNWRTEKQIKVDLAPMFKKKNIEFLHSAATKVIPENNQITTANGEIVDYDYLVIATGPQLAFDEIKGLGPNGYTESICATNHATIAGEKWQKFVENPGPIVVGAAQGASCFGPAYEYALILDTDLRKRKIRHKVPITFVTSEPYIGHLGLDGVGDTKSLLESKLRDANIKWITNAKISEIKESEMLVTECFPDGKEINHDPLAFKHAMILPAFRGIEAVAGIEGLVNPRDFILTNDYQQNPTYSNVFSVGVCVAIPPLGRTPVPVGVPKTGYMIESMVTATAHNIKAMIDGQEPSTKATLSAFCLADFGNGGVAFIAKPQIPPRNLNWSGSGKWVHLAKVAFEKYFLYKVRKGKSEPFWEKFILKSIGVERLKKTK
ncbi:MAG: FAD-dependent oxidoreductase [Xanthomonadales bacterium]|nr:FAD-dependent oxidoreductase [Xanthomonadales bacterium]